MLPTIINPLPVLISLTAVLGVFVHDTQLDNMAMTAISMPAIISNNNTGNLNPMPVDQHIHLETKSFLENTYNLRSQQPATQPRNKDEKKYVAQRRLMGNTFGNEYSWPSI